MPPATQHSRRRSGPAKVPSRPRDADVSLAPAAQLAPVVTRAAELTELHMRWLAQLLVNHPDWDAAAIARTRWLWWLELTAEEAEAIRERVRRLLEGELAPWVEVTRKEMAKPPPAWVPPAADAGISRRRA